METDEENALSSRLPHIRSKTALPAHWRVSKSTENENAERTSQDMVKESEESGIEEKVDEIESNRFGQVRIRDAVSPKTYERTKVLGPPEDDGENNQNIRPPIKRTRSGKKKTRKIVERSREENTINEEKEVDPHLESRRRQDAIDEAFQEVPTPRYSAPSTPKEQKPSLDELVMSPDSMNPHSKTPPHPLALVESIVPTSNLKDSNKLPISPSKEKTKKMKAEINETDENEKPKVFTTTFRENASTGAWKQLNHDRANKKSIIPPGMREDAFRQFIVVSNTAIQVVFVLAQGLLGGVSLVLFFLTYAVHTPNTFLKYYSRVSSVMQHVYFVLTTISLLASFDKLAKDKLKGWDWRMNGRKQKLVDGILVTFYFIAFIASLVNAPTDDLLYYSERRIPGWWDEPFDSKFQRDLTIWHVFNVIRIVGGFFGWLFVSFETRSYDFNPTSYYDDVTEMEQINKEQTTNEKEDTGQLA